MGDFLTLAENCRIGWEALLNKENDTAFSLAEEILSLNAVRHQSGRREMGYAYEGYSIMGIVYCRNGNLELAKNQLKLAGMSLAPTASNRTFGPHFCLMQALYEKGVRSQLVDFIREYCLPICEMKRGELEEWIKEIEASNEVEFRADIESVVVTHTWISKKLREP